MLNLDSISSFTRFYDPPVGRHTINCLNFQSILSDCTRDFTLVCILIVIQLSYQVVDSMIWLGIRSIINDFRKKKLKLRPIPYLSSQGSLADLPTGYLWSPQLVPKPDGMLQTQFLYMAVNLRHKFYSCFFPRKSISNVIFHLKKYRLEKVLCKIWFQKLLSIST